MALSPGSWSSFDWLNTSDTRPTPVTDFNTPSAVAVTIPAPSWPRCCSAWSAR
ncbi:hypothetical protein HanIR_Chr17g0875441 [Helianthus annuus]|nr:hypothetical protein HanIR_Chr17g0875441 [Helianthus annuus]